ERRGRCTRACSTPGGKRQAGGVGSAPPPAGSRCRARAARPRNCLRRGPPRPGGPRGGRGASHPATAQRESRGRRGGPRGRLRPEGPPAAVLRQVRQGGDYAAIEPAGERGLLMRVVVPLPATAWVDDNRVLQLLQPVPASLAESAETVQAVYRDYRELSLLRV